MPKGLIDFLYDATKGGNYKLLNQFLRESENAAARRNPNFLKDWFNKHPNDYSGISYEECVKLIEIQQDVTRGAVPDSY